MANFSVCGAVIAQHTVLSFSQFPVTCTVIKRYFKTVTMYAFMQAHPHNAHGYLQVELASACTEELGCSMLDSTGILYHLHTCQYLGCGCRTPMHLPTHVLVHMRSHPPTRVTPSHPQTCRQAHVTFDPADQLTPE